MAEGARNVRREAEDTAMEIHRRKKPEPEGKDLSAPEISDEYLGDVSARLFDLQAERARLEGDGASAAELLKIDAEIAPLQAFVDEHAEDYARLELPRETTKTVRVPEKLREKPSERKTQLKDLQKRYDLTAAQLETETDPDARMALENGLDSLRERIHGLKADVPWEKEDKAFAKGTIKRETAARIKARETSGADFEAAEVDRALLIDLRDTYARTLESGAASKAGETLLRGAVQTVEDALTRYGRGDLSVGDFQNRVKDILKARKMWDRYVADEGAAARKKVASEEKHQALVSRTKEAVNRMTEEKREARERRNSEFRSWLEAAKAKRQAQKDELRGLMDDIFAMQREREAAEAAPPPENLPVAEEIEELRGASEADFQAKLATFETLTGSTRNKMLADVEAMAKGAGVANDRYTRMREANYPGWLDPDFEQLAERLRRRQETMNAQRKFARDVDTLAQESIARVNAKIDALQEKVRAEKKRLAGDVSESEAEARFFAQGENPQELAARERAQELYPDLPPDEAVQETQKIEAKSARDFENEAEFTAAFVDAVEKDPAHRLNPGTAAEYAKQYWGLLMKDNTRLVAAMEPPPKVGFWKRLFGGGPKAEATMSAQDIVQFQKMDKQVRDIMESPETNIRSIRTGGPARATLPSGGPLGRPR